MFAPSPAEPGRWRLETNDWCLVAPNGTLLALTAPERCVLQLLFAAAGEPVEREALVTALAGSDRDFDARRLDALVHRLRRKAEVQDLFRDWHQPIPALIEATTASDILKTDACDRPKLGHWGHGRVTLLGDAAHPMTPNLGQGACMAIEDAAGLAKALGSADDVPAAFRAYEALRESRTAFVVRQARRIGIIGQWGNPLLVRGRNFVTGLVLAHPPRGRLNAIYGYEA